MGREHVPAPELCGDGGKIRFEMCGVRSCFVVNISNHQLSKIINEGCRSRKTSSPIKTLCNKTPCIMIPLHPKENVSEFLSLQRTMHRVRTANMSAAAVQALQYALQRDL